MNTKEFIKAMDELDRQREEIRRQYIEDNQPIPPGRLVMVDGKKKWLECYKIVGVHIHPRFHDIKQDGTRSYKQYSPVDEKSMRPVKE